MWYRLAAYGKIDLDKYISEDLSEDFNIEEELERLLEFSVSPSYGLIDFYSLNENLKKSRLKKYISSFQPSRNKNARATYNPRTKVLGLRDLQEDETIENLIQSIKHEIRHAVDKGRKYRTPHISNAEIDLAVDFFNNHKVELVDPNTGKLLYDQDQLVFYFAYDYISKDHPEIESLPDQMQKVLIDQMVKENISRPDQLYDVFVRLSQNQEDSHIAYHYYINDPQEYTTLLSDVDMLISPQAIRTYYDNLLQYTTKEKLINALRLVFSSPNQDRSIQIIANINFEGANLLSYIFEFAQNRAMIRNALKILNDNFQAFLSQLNTEETEQTKEAKKKYNAPRTGKMKKRWSVKHKKGINCNSPKGFSAKQYCKRKRRGGAYKKED
jgi:hypothetical protein